MTSSLARALSTPVLAAAGIVPALAAQDPAFREGGEALAAEVRACLAAAAPSEEAGTRLKKAIAAIVAQPKSLDHAAYFDLAKRLFAAGQYDCCASLCRTGIANIADKTGLHDYLGMSHLALAQSAATGVAMRKLAAEAIAAFDAARASKSRTDAHRIFLGQALMLHCEFARALADWDEVTADPRLRRQFRVNPHGVRGMILLCLGRYRDAVQELTHESLDAAEREKGAVLRIRALALAGDVARAEAEARARWKQKPGGETLGVLADVLVVAGKRKEAQQLLRENPVTREDAGEDFADLRQGRAAFEYLIRIGDGRPEDLLGTLASHLGHHMSFRVHDPRDGEEMERATASPLGIAMRLRRAPIRTTDWASQLLFVVCTAEHESYTPTTIEEAVMKRLDGDLPRALADRKRAMAVLRGCLLMYEDGGVMTALRLAERL